MNIGTNQDQETNKYVKFLEERVKESLEENRRVLQKYSDIRHFAY